jgi:hypothetical protein
MHNILFHKGESMEERALDVGDILISTSREYFTIVRKDGRLVAYHSEDGDTYNFPVNEYYQYDSEWTRIPHNPIQLGGE